MKPALLLPSLALAGLLAGFAAHRVLGTGTPAEPSSVGESATSPDPDRTATIPVARPLRSRTSPHHIPSGSHIRSEDTLETLKALPDDELYARLAVWMIDASAEEIASFWTHYRSRDTRQNEINDMIFVNWTRVDPRGAIDAATGTPDEHYAWWAWTCHAPEAALAAVLVENPGRLNNVTWGLGEFHPEWVMANIDKIPEDGRANALHGLAKWDDVADPAKVLEFFEEQEYGFQPRFFQVLARKDPWAAYDFIKERGETFSPENGRSYDLMGPFLEVIGEQHPEVLDRLIAESPPGSERRKLEAMAFERQLKTDPESAIARAMAEEAPRIAQQQLALAGQSLIHSDPDRAFELAERLLEVAPEASGSSMKIYYPNGMSGHGGTPEVSALMSALLAADSERAMELATSVKDQHGNSPAAQNLANQWVRRDLAGYAEWAATLSDPSELAVAARPLVQQLQSESRFYEASEWALAGEENQRRSTIFQVMHEWKARDSEAAREWAAQAPLSDLERETIDMILTQ